MNRDLSCSEGRSGPTTSTGLLKSHHHDAMMIAAQSFALAVMKSSRIDSLGGGDWISFISAVESAAAQIDHPELKRCLVEPMEVSIAVYLRTINHDLVNPLAQ